MKIQIRNRKEFLNNFYKKLSIHQKINIKVEYQKIIEDYYFSDFMMQLKTRKLIYKYYIK